MEKVALYTLGCKVNQYEKEAMAVLFKKAGYKIVAFSEPADIYIIHTCTVTHLGASKSRNIIRRAKRTNPDAFIAVTGCYAQVYPDEILDIEGVDIVLGSQDRNKIVELIEEKQNTAEPVNYVREFEEDICFEPLFICEDQKRTRAMIKIEEGCDQHCSYCIIPEARGPVRSRTLDSIIQEVHNLTDEGFKEIVLCGVNLGAYGQDFDCESNLSIVLKKLHMIDSVKRIRLSSIEPAYIDRELRETISAYPKICNHLHIPLQHGDDEILEKMGRNYSLSEYRALVDKLKYLMPDLGISTDLMVGFPGESESHFKNMLSAVKDISFSSIHVFRYSKRPGTKASKLDSNIDPQTVKTRSRILRDLASDMSFDFYRQFVGKEVEVLVETEKEIDTQSFLYGLTENYIPVYFKGSSALFNNIVPVNTEKAFKEGLRGYYNAD